MIKSPDAIEIPRFRLAAWPMFRSLRNSETRPPASSGWAAISALAPPMWRRASDRRRKSPHRRASLGQDAIEHVGHEAACPKHETTIVSVSGQHRAGSAAGGGATPRRIPSAAVGRPPKASNSTRRTFFTTRTGAIPRRGRFGGSRRDGSKVTTDVPDNLPDRMVGYNCRTKGCGLSGLGRPGRGKSTVCYSPRHRSRRPQEPRDWSGVNTTRVMQVALP